MQYAVEVAQVRDYVNVNQVMKAMVCHAVRPTHATRARVIKTLNVLKQNRVSLTVLVILVILVMEKNAPR